jgi:hypothetical protein
MKPNETLERTAKGTDTAYRYKYSPEDYEEMACLSDDMADFYHLLEMYHENITDENECIIDKQRRELFFSIKHRVVEGYITGIQAQEMRDYFGELFDGVRKGQNHSD